MLRTAAAPSSPATATTASGDMESSSSAVEKSGYLAVDEKTPRVQLGMRGCPGGTSTVTSSGTAAALTATVASTGTDTTLATTNLGKCVAADRYPAFYLALSIGQGAYKQ
jgi:hypothetical protein